MPDETFMESYKLLRSTAQEHRVIMLQGRFNLERQYQNVIHQRNGDFEVMQKLFRITPYELVLYIDGRRLTDMEQIQLFFSYKLQHTDKFVKTGEPVSQSVIHRLRNMQYTSNFRLFTIARLAARLGLSCVIRLERKVASTL